MRKRVSVKGKGADLFFGDDAPPPAAPLVVDASPAEPAALPTPAEPPQEPGASEPMPVPAPRPATPQRPRSRPASQHTDESASTLASTPDSSVLAPSSGAVVEAIRKTVKAPGKEVSFVRLTPHEKGRLADIVYTYKRQGVKTSENEINRIAVNYMLADYDEHGEQSVLAKVLAALRA